MRYTAIQQLGRPAALLGLSAAGPVAGAAVAAGVMLGYEQTLRGGGVGVAAALVVGGWVACGLWLLPTHVLSLLCGWSLGWLGGFAAALVTATAAAPLGLAVARRLGGDGAMAWVERYPKGAAVCEAITRSSWGRAAMLVGLLRLSPVVPFGATNVLCAAFGVRRGPFVVGTLVGLAPRVAAVVALGAGLERLDFSRPGGLGWLVVGVAATGLVVVVMGEATRRTLRGVTADAGGGGDTAARVEARVADVGE
ncbi:MAG: VTT domain-containing protein [Planctomycetota bacterium]